MIIGTILVLVLVFQAEKAPIVAGQSEYSFVANSNMDMQESLFCKTEHAESDAPLQCENMSVQSSETDTEED
jgi:hypothetical protein